MIHETNEYLGGFSLQLKTLFNVLPHSVELPAALDLEAHLLTKFQVPKGGKDMRCGETNHRLGAAPNQLCLVSAVVFAVDLE